jgi:hypothetical protein
MHSVRAGGYQGRAQRREVDGTKGRGETSCLGSVKTFIFRVLGMECSSVMECILRKKKKERKKKKLVFFSVCLKLE